MAVDAISKERLIQELRASGGELLAKLREVPAEEFEKGCYENGWNGRQVLAHVAGIEWTYPRLLDTARNAGEPPKSEEKPKETQAKPAQGGIGSYNDRTVERYKDTPVSELLDIFEENRKTTIAAVEAADEDLLAVPVRSAGGIPGPVGTVLNYVAVLHVRGHMNDILQAAGRM
jgi:hypothetical protein